MGSVVKSIGKAIKKVAKGIKKVIKKIGPALIVAAAVWMGVSALGAGVTGASGFGVSNFQAGLGKIGSGISGFFSPGGGQMVTQTLGQGTAGQATLDATAAASSGTASVAKKFVGANMNMSTGDALIYMTKMNMLSTGVQMVAGFLDDSEEKQLQAEVEAREHKYAY